jgi:hypothetical protein
MCSSSTTNARSINPAVPSMSLMRRKHSGVARCCLVVGVYIDDLVITGSDCDGIKSFKEEMMVMFKMSDLSLFRYSLSIEVKHSTSGVSLRQGAYAMKLLERCGLARRYLELVHDDLCGSIAPLMLRGNKYFLLLVDDLSRYMWVVVIPSKDRAAAAIKEIQAWAEGESGLKLRACSTDYGGELTARDFTKYYATESVHHQHTTPYSL